MINAYQRARILLLVASVTCGVVFWWMARTFGFPVAPGMCGSLAMHPGGVGFFLAVAATFFASMAVGTVLAGVIRFNAGLVAACIGLAVLSVRGGDLRQVLFGSIDLLGASEVFERLALETVLLGMLVGCGWYVLKWLHLRGLIVDREGDPAAANKDVPSRNEALSVAVQTLVTALCMLLLMANEAKFQAIAAVGISSLVGGIVAQYLFPTASNGWYWLPPLVVGVIGFVLAYFNPAGANTGELVGRFAALGRPVPLDYAGSGVAAAIIGHWLARAWQRGK
ncbi:MAG: hypothetical protein ACHRHE_11500 [Tepidisphaerales bacterium]